MTNKTYIESIPESNTINFKVKIDMSKNKVWEILSDFIGIDKWAPLVVNSAATTKRTATATCGIGCERSCEIQGMGSIQERVTEWNEGNGFTVEIKPMPGTPVRSGFTTWSLEYLDNKQTVVKVISKFLLEGTEKEKKAFLLHQAPHLFESSLTGLKCYAENSEMKEGNMKISW